MATFQDHCESIARQIQDYRQGELQAPNADHVERWARQFDPQDQQIIAAEIDHLFPQLYFGRQRISNFLTDLASNAKLTGGSPKAFWQTTSLLNLQGVSDSQRYFVNRLSEIILATHQIAVSENDTEKSNWVYVDDGLFSGGQAIQDLNEWLDNNDVSDGTLHLIAIVIHEFGTYDFKRKVGPKLRARGIKLEIWRCHQIENRVRYRNNADVLWPNQVYCDPTVDHWLQLRAANLGQFQPRDGDATGTHGLYSSRHAKTVLERAFTIKGAHICTLSQTHRWRMKPLGYSTFSSYGFGTIYATCRNCPNNAPLVLWWGNPYGGAPLNQWYPLLQRRVRPQEDVEDWDF